MSPRALLGAVLLLMLSGCAARHESATRRALTSAARAMQQPPSEPAPDGSLARYVDLALRDRPQLEADLARWRAATLRIDAARRIPEPFVSYGFYASPVETRVGPQRHRVSLRQTLPWPSGVTAAADAQSARAMAAQRRFEARALDVRREVAEAWWQLWRVRRSAAALEAQASVLGTLAESQRARMEVGGASAADVMQVELQQTRLADRIASLGPEENQAEARLRAVVGLAPDTPVPTSDAPPPAQRVGWDETTLRERVGAHPFLRSFVHRAEAAREQAGVEEAARFPRLVLGADWIETGDAVSPLPNSGQDAVIVSIGVSVPLFQGRYESAQRAAEADAHAFEADGREAESLAQAQLTSVLSAVENTHRRWHLVDTTMLPQAREVTASLIGNLAASEAPLASVLLAVRDQLDLTLLQLEVRAAHGRAWARLESVVGQPVPAEAP